MTERLKTPKADDAVLGGISVPPSATIDIRLMGGKQELDAVTEALKVNLELLSISADYANRNSSNQRRYIKARLRRPL